jgi:hypothetical protein
MNDIVVVAIITSVTSLVGIVLAKKLSAIHVLVNSRLTAALEELAATKRLLEMALKRGP